MRKINPFTEDRVSSIGMHGYATNFYQAYSLVSGDSSKNSIVVRYYLICHSLELSMKAVLREVGYSVSKIQKLGHDLEKIANELKNNDISRVLWTKKQLEIIQLANLHYQSKEMEYFARGSKLFVDFRDFEEFMLVWLPTSMETINNIRMNKKNT